MNEFEIIENKWTFFQSHLSSTIIPFQVPQDRVKA